MDNTKLIDASKDLLTRVLAFFPRVDNVSSVLLGVNLGMLALLANKTLPFKLYDWQIYLAVVPALLIGGSLYHLFRGYFPRLEGGPLSLIYFREIAQRKETEFIEGFRAQTEEAYVNDLLNQAWRNSQILTQKFNHLSKAFVFLAWAIIPWLIALAILTARSAETTTQGVTKISGG
jgi:hypothetical protein